MSQGFLSVNSLTWWKAMSVDVLVAKTLALAHILEFVVVAFWRASSTCSSFGISQSSRYGRAWTQP